MHLFHRIIQATPRFLFATVLTSRDEELKPHLSTIQSVLVSIWRAQISQYLRGDSFSPPPEISPAPSRHTQPEPDDPHTDSSAVLENGHHITSIPAGGVMCLKCGKNTAEPKHRRLKISKQPCAQSHLHKDFWTQSPGLKNNPNHYLDLFATFCQIESEHDLAWNFGLSSKDGKIQCLACFTIFAWDNRYNIKRQRKCTKAHARASTPPKWISYRMYKDDFRTAFQRARTDSYSNVFEPLTKDHTLSFSHASSVDASESVRTRLRSKTTIPNVLHAASSTNSSSSRAPIFAPAVSSEGLRPTTFVHFDDMG